MELGNEHIMGVLILLFSLLGLIVWIWYAVKNKHRWEAAVAPASYLLNSLIFQVVFLTHIITDIHTLNLWSGIVRLHSIFLFIGLGLLVAGRSFSWTQHP